MAAGSVSWTPGPPPRRRKPRRAESSRSWNGSGTRSRRTSILPRPACCGSSMPGIIGCSCCSAASSPRRSVGSRDKAERAPVFFALPVIAACYLHQCALAAILFCLYLLISYRDRASLTSPPYLVVYASAALTYRFWSAYATLHPPESFSFGRYFWGFPKLHDYLLQWLVQGWPRFSVVTGVGLLLLGHRFLQDRTRGTYLFPVALGLLLPLFASAIYWPYYVPRYFFHLYPLLVVVFAFTLTALSTAVLSRVSKPGPEGPRPPGPARRGVEAVALVFLAAVQS